MSFAMEVSSSKAARRLGSGEKSAIAGPVGLARDDYHGCLRAESGGGQPLVDRRRSVRPANTSPEPSRIRPVGSGTGAGSCGGRSDDPYPPSFDPPGGFGGVSVRMMETAESSGLPVALLGTN